jgi:DNA invertase Pin-like site-specific DNA recombinase
MNKPLKIATYSRVSTSHHDQNPQVQVEELRRYCEQRGWVIQHEIIDHGYSGGTTNRPGLRQLLELARSKQIDGIVIMKLDRLFRSLKHLLATLDELKELEIAFVSIGDQIDFSTPSGRLMLHIVAAFGEFERALVRDRTLTGLAHARSKGVKLGRPANASNEKIIALRQQGLSYRQIRKNLGCSMATIKKAITGSASKTIAIAS